MHPTPSVQEANRRAAWLLGAVVVLVLVGGVRLGLVHRHPVAFARDCAVWGAHRVGSPDRVHRVYRGTAAVGTAAFVRPPRMPVLEGHTRVDTLPGLPGGLAGWVESPCLAPAKGGPDPGPALGDQPTSR